MSFEKFEKIYKNQKKFKNLLFDIFDPKIDVYDVTIGVCTPKFEFLRKQAFQRVVDFIFK
jgi:hypothetical protein